MNIFWKVWYIYHKCTLTILQSNIDGLRSPVLYYVLSHNINGGNITTTNVTNIVFTDITVIPGVYDINVSAVNILGERLQEM